MKNGDGYFTGYSKIHLWLLRTYKKRKKCEQCGIENAKVYDWALRKGFNYEMKRRNFIELCRSCHRKYDYTNKWKNRQSQSQIKRWSDPELRKIHSQKMSIEMKRRWKNLDYRKRTIESLRKTHEK